MASCSVVMVSYDTGALLFASVSSVLRQKELAELVVVDNGNPLDVLTRLQQMALTEPRLKIITGQSNVGWAKACNLGVKRATGDFLLLLGHDCLLPPKALADTMRALAQAPDIVLAGCALLNADGSEQPGQRRLLPTPISAWLDVLGYHKRPATPPPSQTHEVGTVSRHFMCMRRNDYLQLSGLDEAFFLREADSDLCMRIRKAHGKIIFMPGVKVIRMPDSVSVGKAAITEWKMGKDYIYYLNKHFHDRTSPVIMRMVQWTIMLRFALNAALSNARRRWQQKPIMSQSVAAKRLMILASGLAELPESDEMRGRTVLVTGATSQIGLCVLRRLIAAGAAVLALSREEGIPFQHDQLRWLKGDLTDAKLNLDSYLIDVVVHCAHITHLPPVMDLLVAAEVKRIIAFSSTSIFTKALSKNSFEKELVGKLTKSETVVAERSDANGIAWTILRPTLIYGVGLDKNVTTLAKFIRRFGWFPVYPPAFGRRQPVHADDLAMAVLQSVYVQSACGKAYNVSGGEIISYRQMLERLFALCRKKTRIVQMTTLPFALDLLGLITRKKHINGEIARRMNDDLIFFHDEASKDFGFDPRPFLSGGIRDIEGF